MARIKLRPLRELTSQVVAELGRVGPVSQYVKHMAAGDLRGYEVFRGRERIGVVALRAERRPDRLMVLVIVAASVNSERGPVLVDGIETIKDMAREGGFSFVRAHVRREAAARSLIKCGGQAILNFATPQEFRSTDRDFILSEIAAGREVVFMVGL